MYGGPASRDPAVPIPITWLVPLAFAIQTLALSTSAMATFPHSGQLGATDMAGQRSSSLLASYYEKFLKNQDVDAFQRAVSARYSEATLGRLLQTGDMRNRRAAVLALGMVGSFAANEFVAQALRDPDPGVRRLADGALWSIWYRADTPENNALLQKVRELVSVRRFEEACVAATRLIARAPRFAEAYNQRAIALFLMGRMDESAADCRRVLELNPYHFGALSGLGQCYLQLSLPREALKTYRRALKLQPYSDDLREAVEALEADHRP
jgi:tetratricopeptide (TPR) repeat protein